MHNEATGATFSIGKSMPAEYAIFTISKALKVFLCATKPSTNVAFLSQHKISHINLLNHKEDTISITIRNKLMCGHHLL